MRDRSLTLLFRRYREHGDGRALAAVFDGCAKPLLELACHLVRDPSEAEDLVQATFLAAIRGAQRFDERVPLEGWLYGILWREAARARRRAARRVDPARLEERVPADPLDVAAGREVPEAVSSALAALPPRYREVLEPLLFHDQRADHIARDLARSPGTVRSQIHRGLEELRRALAPRFAAYGALALPTRGLDAVRGTVLKAAGFSPATVATSSVATLGLVAGGMLVSKSVLAGAAVAVLVVSGTWIALERPSEAGRRPRRDEIADTRNERANAGKTDVEEQAYETERADTPADRSESPPVAENPAEPARSFEETVQHWLARFAEAPEDWRHGWSVAAEIAKLPPEEALAVMKAVWPHLSVPVKEQALKPYVFHGGHVHALPILHLAATDVGAPTVQSRAFGYLRSYAFRDFALDYQAYLEWSARNAERPLGDVLRESASAFVTDLLSLSLPALEQRMRELDDSSHLRAGQAARLDLAAEMRAAGGARVLEAALASTDRDTVNQALAWSKELRVDERWLRTWVLPRIAEADPGTIDACFRALQRPDCVWARDAILAHLDRGAKTALPGASSAAQALAEMNDPSLIPVLIGLLLRDQTGELDYDVGYFGISKLTGVKWQESYDGEWWASWWEKNRTRFPAEVAALEARR